MINIIAAVGKNLELGKNNDLIWHLPNDLKYFKNLTLGKTVVMGRNTYNSIGKALSDRKNIVLTKQNIDIKDCIVMHDYNDILTMNDEIFIIGGESIYKIFITHADNLYLTEIDAECFDADTYFPSFDKSLYDKEIIRNEEYNNLNYSYVRYRKK